MASFHDRNNTHGVITLCTELWNNVEMVEDVKEDVLNYLAQLYRENAPEFIYFKTLYHIFEKFLLDQETGGLLDQRVHLFDTGIWNALYTFQKDGAKGAINKIERHGGCDCLINYDIHWNPVRIIQRFGRIDRIGSRNISVRLINFWPTKDLDRYITLKDRVEARMALVDITATADDNLLQEDIRDLIEGDLKYRDKHEQIR